MSKTDKCATMAGGLLLASLLGAGAQAAGEERFNALAAFQENDARVLVHGGDQAATATEPGWYLLAIRSASTQVLRSFWIKGRISRILSAWRVSSASDNWRAKNA